MPKLTIEKIAEIKNALTIISLDAQIIMDRYIALVGAEKERQKCQEIAKQVKRIDRLLPQIKYEKKGGEID